LILAGRLERRNEWRRAHLPDTQATVKKAGKRYDPVIYEGAGHGFMRTGEDPSNTLTPTKKLMMRPGSAGGHC
jgi:hypothetical protein